jgi:hypothetical protein
VVNGREYAFGGHDKHGVTGVYWTKPLAVPPGGTFRSEILHGFTVAPQEEIDAIIREASEEFQGTAYNILTKNCNHFTQYLCQKLTGRPGPGWLNRAANIGVALPCVVPREWIEPPDFDTADGALLDDDENDRNSEQTRFLSESNQRPRLVNERGRDQSLDSILNSEDDQRRAGSGKAKGKGKGKDKGKGKEPATDSAGRLLPVVERA